MGELDSGYSLCDRLMSLGCPEGWQVCALLAQQRPQHRPRAQAKLLDYALAHCTAAELPGLLALRNNVELSLVCEAANTQMGAEVAAPPLLVNTTVHTRVEAADHIHAEVSGDVVEPTSDGEDPYEDAKDTAWLSSAATGGSLLTSVAVVAATRALWTSAGRWLTQRRQQRQDQGEDALLDNSRCRLQGCHAFYADNCPEAHCSVLGCSYSSYAPGGGCGALQAPLLLLRAAMLQRTLQGEDGGDDALCQVVQAAAKAALPEDTALGLAFLMLLPQPHLSKDVLDALPHTDIAIQVSQYYYALQIYSLLHPWPHPSPAPVLLHDPATVIACVAHVTHLYYEHVQGVEDDGSINLQRGGVKVLTGQSTTDGKLTEYYDYFRRTEELLDDYLQGQALLRIDAHIDIERFLKDSSYKEDTVLGLCMTTDTSVLALAVTLAGKYGVPLWQVHMTHLQHLFGVDLTTQELTEVIAERGIMATLKTRPDEFVTCMEKNVLALIDGCDHTRLLLFYSLVQECEGKDGRAARHVGVLEELRAAAPGLSYHHLLAHRPDTLQHLGAVLTPTNLSAVASLLTRVPGGAVTRSTAHCAYCIARFLTISTHGEGQPSVRDWWDGYSSLHAEMAELSSEDLLQMLRAITISEDAFRLVPLQSRVAVLDAAVKDTVHRTEEYAVVAETLLQWKVHLAGLQSPAFEALSRSPDLALRRCARLYGLSGGGASAASALCEQALLEGGDLALIRELLTALPEDSTPLPEDILHGLLQRGMDALVDPQHHSLMPAGARDNPPQQRQWWVSRLQHLTAVLGCELREGNDLLTEELLTETARATALHPRPPLQDRLALLRALQENVPPSEEDQYVLLLLETCSLLQAAALPVQGDWRGEVEREEDVVPDAAHLDTRGALPSGTVLITVASLESAQERETLFLQLLDVTIDANHTRALLDLLLLWPAFSAEVYESLSGNPWELLLTKLVRQTGATPHDQQLIFSSVQHALKHRQLPGSGVSHVCHALVGAGRHAWCIAGRVALLVDCPHALIAVVAAYTGAGSEVCSVDYDDALLEGLLRGMHLQRLLHTPLYVPCCDYLIRADDSALLYRVLQHLQQHAPDEAAALQRRAAAARPASASLSTAFRTVCRKLL